MIYHGFFSSKARETCKGLMSYQYRHDWNGRVVAEMVRFPIMSWHYTPEGEIVGVTCADLTTEADDYLWDDKRYIGPLNDTVNGYFDWTGDCEGSWGVAVFDLKTGKLLFKTRPCAPNMITHHAALEWARRYNRIHQGWVMIPTDYSSVFSTKAAA